jgi:hypothetical protein
MEKSEFIIILLLVLICFYVFLPRLNEGFKNQNPNPNQPVSTTGETDGIYNYFFGQVLNPYPYPMTKFFSNDTQKMPDPPKPYIQY